MHRRLLPALAVAALLVAACGDDDAGDDAEATAEYQEALAASMAEDEDVPFAPEDIDCLAGEFVDAIGGAPALEDAGVTPEELRDSDDLQGLGLDLGDAEADAVAASFGACDVSLAQLVLDEAGEEVPAEVRTCVEENLDEDVLADFLANLLVDADATEDLPAELLEPLTACF